MTEFRSKWRDFVPRKHTYPTDKTDKRSAAVTERVMYPTDKTDKRVGGIPETHRNPTDKTDKRSFVGSVSPSSKQFELNGWVAIDSKYLGEIVLLVRDGQPADTVPQGYAIYTESEVERLKGIAPDELRQVHYAKKFWNGTITGKVRRHQRYDER